jgi:tetratricopeptide (TPR) repeat protein
MKDKISEIIAGKDTPEKMKGPAERLKDLEERTSELAKMRDESMERMNKLMPGFGDIFKSIGQTTNKMMEVSKRTLKGQAALQNSDPAGACAEFEAAIALLGDEVFDISRRCDLLTNLADAQFKNGDPQSAEASFQRAFEDAKNLEEAQSPTLPYGNAHHRYACFLRDTEKLVEAEEHFKLATAKHAAQMQDYITKGFMAADSSTENWLIKEDYAKLLRKLGRDEEAQQMEDESKALKAKAPATEK